MDIKQSVLIYTLQIQWHGSYLRCSSIVESSSTVHPNSMNVCCKYNFLFCLFFSSSIDIAFSAIGNPCSFRNDFIFVPCTNLQMNHFHQQTKHLYYLVDFYLTLMPPKHFIDFVLESGNDTVIWKPKQVPIYVDWMMTEESILWPMESQNRKHSVVTLNEHHQFAFVYDLLWNSHEM